MLTPRPYQTEAIQRVLRQSYLLLDDCGLGKTLTAIEAAKLLLDGSKKPVLIVIPKRIKLQWVARLQQQGVQAASILLLDAKGLYPATFEKYPTKTALKRAGLPAEHTFKAEQGCIVLAHYEAVVKYCETLQQTLWGLIVADEAHKLRNRKAQRTVALKALKAERKLAMTATPYDRNPADVWSLLQWVRPDFFRSYWRFFDAHVACKEVRVAPYRNPATGTWENTVKTPVGMKHPATFAALLNQFSLRRTKADVRPDMPAKLIEYVDVEMDSDQARIYAKIADSDDLEVELTEDVTTVIPIVLTYILRLIQATTDPTLLGVQASSAKLDWVLEWVEANANEPVIIFTRFRDTAIKLAGLLSDKLERTDVLLITGGSSAPAQEAVDAAKLIVGTTAAMGEGLDLPHIDTAIFLDCEWSSILMQQAVDRIYRINITNAKRVIYLRAKDTYDNFVLAAVKQKLSTQELVSAFLTGARFAELTDEAA